MHTVKLQTGYSAFHVVKLTGNFQTVLLELLFIFISLYAYKFLALF